MPITDDRALGRRVMRFNFATPGAFDRDGTIIGVQDWLLEVAWDDGPMELVSPNTVMIPAHNERMILKGEHALRARVHEKGELGDIREVVKVVLEAALER